MWKTLMMRRLLELKKKYQNNQEIIENIDALIKKLYYLKSRDIVAFLKLLNDMSKEAPELLELLPKEEEIRAWMTKQSRTY